MRHVKKQHMTDTLEKKQATETACKSDQRLDLIDKDIKVTVINMN